MAPFFALFQSAKFGATTNVIRAALRPFL